MRRRRLLALAATVLAAGATGCATSISARHTPLYRDTPHTSTIEVQAANGTTGIKKITIDITRGTMIDCSDLGGPPTVFPCRVGASSTTHVCAFGMPWPSSATCDADLDLGDEEMVTYQATAIPGSGPTRSTPPITFAAGQSPEEFLARPVWWHRSEPLVSRIDLGFFPDSDYDGDYAEFTDDLEILVTQAFFDTVQPNSRLYSQFREVHNLWAAPFGANAQGSESGCPDLLFTDEVMPIEAAMDGGAIFHRNEFRDCASISLGSPSAGSVWSGADDAAYILVHESGHFLHGQGDEYCCDGGYSTAGNCRNVFGSLADCQGYASTHGFNPGQCVEIVAGGGAIHTGAWRVDDGLDEMMREREPTSDWRNTSRQCVQNRYGECFDGSCY